MKSLWWALCDWPTLVLVAAFSLVVSIVQHEPVQACLSVMAVVTFWLGTLAGKRKAAEEYSARLDKIMGPSRGERRS